MVGRFWCAFGKSACNFILKRRDLVAGNPDLIDVLQEYHKMFLLAYTTIAALVEFLRC